MTHGQVSVRDLARQPAHPPDLYAQDEDDYPFDDDGYDDDDEAGRGDGDGLWDANVEALAAMAVVRHASKEALQPRLPTHSLLASTLGRWK